ncbi:MAG: anti-sigma factor antagonist [Lachnospiraceae bacterium]|nr:anti-sigma factor antagonist [Lachnospiraceae bacterium]
MENIMYQTENNLLTLHLSGHIDSANAPRIEEEINRAIETTGCRQVCADCAKLDYISSAGLRIFLHLRKRFGALKVVNVSTEIYEILDMTGFTEMLEVHKAYRQFSIEGCEIIGSGANGKVYRIDPDTIVKVYDDADALPEIKRERELARKAFIAGIPTAIPYDVVRVGSGYGSVFELLNAQSFASLLAQDPGRLDELVDLSVDLLNKIHGTRMNPGEMPNMRETVLGWVQFLKPYLPENEGLKLTRLVEAVPDHPFMLHGDYHFKNVMMQNGETLLIDMDTLSIGHPIFELGSVYAAYLGYSELEPEKTQVFYGFSHKLAERIWTRTIDSYLDRFSEKVKRNVENQAKLISAMRVMRRAIRRHGMDEPEGRAVIALCKGHITELLEQVDRLDF